ncbi:MAG: hypothetical protein AAGF91_02170, partial [Actinomycetota bacterium]
TAWDTVVFPVWAAAAFAAVAAVRRRDRVVDREVIAAAALAVAWCCIVVGMATVLGYAALSRFLLPAAALVCVLAGVGVARLVAVLADGQRRSVVVAVALGVVAVVTVSVGQLWDRVTGLEDVVSEIRARAFLSEDLPDVIDAAGGKEAVLACGTVAVQGVTLLLPSVAWELDVPISELRTTPEEGPAVWFIIANGRVETELLASDESVRTLARSAVWAVHAVDCDEPAVPD